MTLLEQINSPQDLKQLSDGELRRLATEIRHFLVHSVAQTGGHLASNLGVVELTIALHKVFDAPEDVLIWDVGHQSYVHKILTGRRDRFDSLRTYGGMSGFPRSAESEYDAFDGGHSSTSISAALGFACARDLQGKHNSVVAILGDGAMTGGLAYEGLNNAGRMKSNFIVVLNNNEMSIAKNVGSMSKYLNKLRTEPFYNRAKKEINDLLKKIPVVGNSASRGVSAIKDKVRKVLAQTNIFEELGFTCYGPIDGHNIEELTRVLELAKQVDGPVLLHVDTKKGKGYPFAERNPNAFHGIGAFDVQTGKASGRASEQVSASKAFGSMLTQLGRSNPLVVGITAAMPDGTGMSQFAKELPKRFFDVGIAEQHAVTFAGGLAKAGQVPVVAVYSTFLQRGFDSIFHDVALQNLHVVFALDRSGVVGEDGETHHGIFDLSYLTPLPHMAVLAPSSVTQLEHMLAYAVNEHKGPIALRYPKAMHRDEPGGPFVFGKAQVVQEGSSITLLSVGSMLPIALEAARRSGESVEVIDLRTVKPLDVDTIIASAQKTGKVITLEDNVKLGGVGSMVASAVEVPVISLGYGDEPVPHGSIRELHRANGLDAESVAQLIKKECHCEKAS